MIGVDDADHAVVGVDDRQGVEVVLVEHLGKLVLVKVGRTGEDARLGEDGETGSRLGHDQARERDDAAKDALFVEEVDLGKASPSRASRRPRSRSSPTTRGPAMYASCEM